MGTTTNSELTPQRIMQLSWGYALPLIIEAAVKYHLFDLLDGSPKTAPQLAEEARVSAPGRHRPLQRAGGVASAGPEGRLLQACAGKRRLSRFT